MPRFAHHQDMRSRVWGFYVNVLAASPGVGDRLRLEMVRRAGLQIGEARIAPRCYFHSSELTVGDHSLLNHGCHFENVAPVRIGTYTALAPFVRVITSTHVIGPHEDRARGWHAKPVRIGDGCWIGTGVTILPGIEIADGCVIGAGSLVTKDCEADGLYQGIPAARVRDLPAGSEQ